ncbi:notch-regulated ankyrin repeat-containing protein B-like [Oppia nitens]|uniref:notch-regulated ankyrin repeat-containing protein B-like n=1 Tax=Oppia nitens TaxID=1686743 RepID=UPI0023DC0434|nr:notch-regulated ankyrin repeat-containing protein B-like [Oppia nitens]
MSLNSNANQKTMIAKQIVSVIRDDDFDQLVTILRSKPDLNVFINGQTALHYCLLLGRDVSWCRQLVLNGANTNLSNHDGWHPLHLAAVFGHNETLSYLIKCNNTKGMATDVI